MHRQNKGNTRAAQPQKQNQLKDGPSGLSRRSSQHGQAIVEFALAIPLMLVMAFGVIEFARLMFSYSMVVSAAREAARYGSTAENYQDCAGIQAAATRIGSLAGVQAGDVQISYDDGFGGNVRSCPPGVLPLGSRINVAIQGVQYTPFIPMVNLSTVSLQTEARRTILIGLELK
jgi:Flp pilus assembly protein TadG